MDATANSPLVDIAMNYVHDLHKKIPPEQLLVIKNNFIQFVSGKITYQECSARLIPIISSTQPLDKIDEILRTSDWPLPPITVGKPHDPLKKTRVKTRQWAQYEDQRLLAGIHRYGINDWATIARFVGNGRTKSQCAQRWLRVLDPQISKEQWDNEQDSTLLQLISIIGDKSWTKISQFMNGRSDVQCRYRYHQLQKDENFQEKLNEAAKIAKSKDDLFKTQAIKSKSRRKQSQQQVYPVNFNFQQPNLYNSQHSPPSYQPNIPSSIPYQTPQNPNHSVSFNQPKIVYPNISVIDNPNPAPRLVNIPAITEINRPGVVFRQEQTQPERVALPPAQNVYIPPSQIQIKPPIQIQQIPHQIQIQQPQLTQQIPIQISFPIQTPQYRIQQSQIPFQPITKGPMTQIPEPIQHIQPQESIQFDFEISSQNSMTDWGNIRSSASGFGITPSNSTRNF